MDEHNLELEDEVKPLFSSFRGRDLSSTKMNSNSSFGVNEANLVDTDTYALFSDKVIK